MDKIINPEKIYSINWKDGEGYALDVHTVSSEFIGYNDYGHSIYDTKRSYIGELLYNLKFKNDIKVADEIVALALPRLANWSKKFSLVIPVPFTQPRETQPVFLLAEKIAKALGKPCRTDLLEKTSAGQSKNQVKKVEIRATRNEKLPTAVLLIDDIFDTGATLNACVEVLKHSYKVDTVYVLCITKTKNQIIRR